MTRPVFASLRLRLVGWTSVAVLVALTAVAALHALARSGDHVVARLSGLLLGDEFPEPWQDVAILLPFSLILLLMIWAVSVRSLRPLLEASEQAARVGPRDMQARIRVPDLPSEIAPLVDAVNGALDRLAGAFVNERRFTQDAAHELRTPLAALTMRLQRARLGGVTDWDQVERDLAQMRRLVSQLLDLARKESGRAAIDPVPVNLARSAREAAASLLPLIEHAGRVLDVDLDDRALVGGSSEDLRDLLQNLVENALVHGQGRITLAMRVTDRVEIDVGDEGQGPPAALREAVFDRFRKARQDSAGSGLGLAIAQAVVARHGGTIGFVDGPACRVRVALPLAPSIQAPSIQAPSIQAKASPVPKVA